MGGGSLKAAMDRGTNSVAREDGGFGPLDGDEFRICSREVVDFSTESEKCNFERTSYLFGRNGI
jgi:hypothetical protein